MGTNTITQAEVEARIAGLDEETQRKMVCALVGHSQIQSTFFGYYYCARCGEQVGDSLGSCYDPSQIVIVGHNCEICRNTFASLDWKHTFLTPDPFAEAEPEAA